ncbi:helix-turn-helix transcriptional regulator [Rhizobium sp. PL01]|uniref:helix-turn-helix domain-containing protein n=1 Tax=Rhizobium sp. PL01 TaxID=3085631 RepID=UPI002981B55B|nr:helix-turn-helix transcriptional regulator [Rhizobium sp. PL01]MDW5313351.1 helix-turn-helix transcriptional regulator [Rhizobium sp. PL01]
MKRVPDFPVPDHIALMIHDLRQSGLSANEIAERCHLSRTTLWRLAQGEARDPAYDSVRKVEQLHGKIVK